MNEELFEPLPDLQAYLDRIGLGAPQEPTLAYLNDLVYAHHCSIPFDNLDVREHAMLPSLAVADLFEKVVVRKRGGYCFELNALFCALLKALEFNVRPAMARVLMRPGAHPLISHRGNIVTFDSGEYLVDVGFGGPMPAFALKLEDGLSQTRHGQTFTPHVHDELWWDIGFTNSAGEEKVVLRVNGAPAEEQDFVPLSFYQSQNPQSVFRNTYIANIRTADGAHDVHDFVYTHFSGGTKTVTELADLDEMEAVLAEHFGIVGWR